MIQEIFRRIGVLNGVFVEFGVGDGTENNKLYLMFSGWRALWIDGSQINETSINQQFASFIQSGKLEKVLRTYTVRYARLDDVASTTAELPANGKIIGWFQGRMEFGPRALGSRSILADPRDPEISIKVNNAVKFREWWRLFASRSWLKLQAITWKPPRIRRLWF